MADALMELLPPLPWSDIATKQDLAVLESRLETKMAAIGGDLRKEMSAQTRTIMLGMSAVLVTAFGAFAGLAVSLGH